MEGFRERQSLAARAAGFDLDIAHQLERHAHDLLDVGLVIDIDNALQDCITHKLRSGSGDVLASPASCLT